MLYEEQILSQLELKGFQRDKVVRYLDANKHNHETTFYYLILKKLEKEGKIDSKKYFSGENLIKSSDVEIMQKQYLNQRQISEIKEQKQIQRQLMLDEIQREFNA